jgi:hypothetical protein
MKILSVFFVLVYISFILVYGNNIDELIASQKSNLFYT